MRYPYPCSRCGVCCLAVTCEVGQTYFGIEAGTLCPGLSFEGDFHVDPVTLEAVENPGRLAGCMLAKIFGPEILGLGMGCCIKARAIKNGVTYDVAALPPAFKLLLAKQYREARCSP